jgi:hypothetical protein
VFGKASGWVVHPRGILAAALAAAACLFCSSCGDASSFASDSGIVSDARDLRTSVSFDMNRRPVRLELRIRVDGTGATIELDHPDGRTTETIEVAGPGLRELCKELPKEPGSWGLRVSARGGEAAYWFALHDRKRYVGPDDDSRRLVERK